MPQKNLYCPLPDSRLTQKQRQRKKVFKEIYQSLHYNILFCQLQLQQIGEILSEIRESKELNEGAKTIEKQLSTYFELLKEKEGELEE